jgi:hypothetical protein
MIRFGISRPLSLGAPIGATILAQYRTLTTEQWTGHRFAIPRTIGVMRNGE